MAEPEVVVCDHEGCLLSVCTTQAFAVMPERVTGLNTYRMIVETTDL